jgi:hypothetical protein
MELASNAASPLILNLTLFPADHVEENLSGDDEQEREGNES